MDSENDNKRDEKKISPEDIKLVGGLLEKLKELKGGNLPPQKEGRNYDVLPKDLTPAGEEALHNFLEHAFENPPTKKEED